MVMKAEVVGEQFEEGREHNSSIAPKGFKKTSKEIYTASRAFSRNTLWPSSFKDLFTCKSEPQNERKRQ